MRRGQSFEILSGGWKANLIWFLFKGTDGTSRFLPKDKLDLFPGWRWFFPRYRIFLSGGRGGCSGYWNFCFHGVNVISYNRTNM